uniref:Uncharacterized protein n=1 Tax=Sinocyclocheilus anshuiensis TaxID=1608454 RepID=A0A671KGN1_9TELE
MDVSHSIRERTIAENSLVILLQGLHGQVTTVDLRGDTLLTPNLQKYTACETLEQAVDAKNTPRRNSFLRNCLSCKYMVL